MANHLKCCAVDMCLINRAGPRGFIAATEIRTFVPSVGWMLAGAADAGEGGEALALGVEALHYQPFLM